MAAKCGCTGVRSCLLCEVKGQDFSSATTAATQPTLIYTQCRKCGELSLQGANDVTRCHLTSCTPQRIWSPTVSVTPGIRFEGVSVYQEFLSPQEEDDVVCAIDEHLWAESQSGRMKQDYGPKVNFKKRKVKLGAFSGLPSFSEKFVQRIQTDIATMSDFVPVELCNLDYRAERGAAIDPHVDDSWLWGHRLVTLNLLSDTILTFTTQDHTPSRTIQVDVFLPRYSLVVVSGEARCQWQHSIQRQHITSRRVAVTLRELSEEFRPGGESYVPQGKAILEAAALYSGLPTNKIKHTPSLSPRLPSPTASSSQ